LNSTTVNVKRRGGHMPGLVHVIDDDVCFLTAMERRLKYAGYGGGDLCFVPALSGSIAERECPELRSPGRANAWIGRSSSAVTAG